jgi:hypothetical protein
MTLVTIPSIFLIDLTRPAVDQSATAAALRFIASPQEAALELDSGQAPTVLGSCYHEHRILSSHLRVGRI